MGKLAIWAQLEAKPGKEQEVETFLKSAQPLAEEEPGTISWYAIKLGPAKYGIFDTFADENGRNAHLNGEIAMASFTAHHRTADFRALFQRVLADMKEFVGTRNDVLVLACSGTGVMEASVSNLTSPGDKVLVLTAGKFGERWQGLAKAFGCK